MTCPTADQWLRLHADVLDAPEARALEAHAQTCPACVKELRFRRALRSQEQRPRADAIAERALRRTHRGSWVRKLGVAAAALLVGGLTATIVAVAQREPSTLRARGGASSWEAHVAAELRPASALAVPLVDQLTVPQSEAWALWFRNVETARPLHVMAYLVDANGDLHWIAPAYEVEGKEPAPLTLPYSAQPQLWSQMATLEVDDGPATLVTVVSTAPGAVLAFEANPAVARDAPQTLLPGALVWRRTVRILPERPLP